MMEPGWEHRLSDKLDETTEGGASKTEEELAGAAMVSAELPQVVGAPLNDTHLPTRGTVLLMRERLERHPHFRGRSALLEIELIEETIVLSGRLPTYYLRQLLQEVIRLSPAVPMIDNRVTVMRPNDS